MNKHLQAARVLIVEWDWFIFERLIGGLCLKSLFDVIVWIAWISSVFIVVSEVWEKSSWPYALTACAVTFFCVSFLTFLFFRLIERVFPR